MYRTLLRFSPEHHLSRDIVADAHQAHKIVMSGFEHLINRNDFFSDHNEQRHPDHRAAYNVLHAVNVRGNGEVRVIVQSSTPGNWDNDWSDALLEPANTMNVPLITDGDIRYEITLNPVRRKNGGKNRVPINSHDEIIQLWHDKAQRSGLKLLGSPRVINTERRNVSTKKFKMATATIQGFASVSDSAALEEAYKSGIGQCKPYGCGLLLTKRPHKK